jgi:hypothetical protein
VPIDVKNLDESAKSAQFVAKDRVGAGRTLLDHTDVDGGRLEVDLLAAGANQLTQKNVQL